MLLRDLFSEYLKSNRFNRLKAIFFLTRHKLLLQFFLVMQQYNIRHVSKNAFEFRQNEFENNRSSHGICFCQIFYVYFVKTLTIP